MPGKFKSGLNFYGTAKVLGEKRKVFQIHYDSGNGTLAAEIHLPFYRAVSTDGKKRYPLVFKRNCEDDKIEGGNYFMEKVLFITVASFN